MHVNGTVTYERLAENEKFLKIEVFNSKKKCIKGNLSKNCNQLLFH